MAVDTGVWTIDSPVSARHMLLVYSLFAEFLDISMSQVSRQISKLERYPNGVLKLRTASKARTDVRIKHGLFKSWHDNGQVWGKANYKYEKQHGVHEMYYKNGKEYSWSPQCFQNGQEVDISNCK